MASLLPWTDWQFYAVSALALAGLWLGLKPLLARKKAPGCTHCSKAQGGPSPLPPPDRLVRLGGSKSPVSASKRAS